jgi:hypothetical protein
MESNMSPSFWKNFAVKIAVERRGLGHIEYLYNKPKFAKRKPPRNSAGATTR